MVERTIPCEKCGKETIKIIEIPMSMTYKRGFTGKKGYQFNKGRDIILTKRCSECKHEVGAEIKRTSHEERLKRLKEAGFPMIIEG